MTASIAPNAPPTILNMATVSGGGDGNASNNTASDTATVLPASDLAITKSHTGNFTQGQPGTYTLTVSNVGGSPTSGSRDRHRRIACRPGSHGGQRHRVDLP